jgi:heterodisulfide reductase subunit A2
MTNKIKPASQKEADVLVLGGGIAGLESALNLANMGFHVMIVEKDLSIGGRMIHLSKVFPTLDCSACITTPKVSETARHPNIKILNNSEVKNVSREEDGSYHAFIEQKPRYVIDSLCTGCQDCEKACPVVVKDEYQYNLVGRKAAFIPFSIASPRIAAIDLDNCILCGACEKACGPGAIDFTQEVRKTEISVKSIIVATGFKLFNPDRITRYGGGRFKNVITAMQMERQLVPTRPFNTVLRPGDGKLPDKIAYVLCAGSRDATVDNAICSQICCMYSIKQAQLILGAVPMADVTVYFLHIRAFGKGFDEFYQQAKMMDVQFIKGKVGRIKELDNGDLMLRYEDIATGLVKEAQHDLVVLSVGILPNMGVEELFGDDTVKIDPFKFYYQPNEMTDPFKSNLPGVFIAGTSSGPMDIPDSILSAGAAAAQAAKYMKQHQASLSSQATIAL